MKNCNKTFPNVSRDKVASIIKKLNTEKASKSDDILSKVIKEFGTFFGNFLSKNFNSCLKTGSFPVNLKLFPFTWRMVKWIKVTIDL